MKTILISVLLFGSIIIYAQNEEIIKEDTDSTDVYESETIYEEFDSMDDEFVDEDELEMNEDEDQSILKKGDTTKIRIGKKAIKIINDGEETYISVIEPKDSKKQDYDFEIEDEDLKFKKEKPSSNFEGHWAGLEIGLNNFDGPEYNFMELNATKSINVNLNLFQYSFGLFSKHIGLVTGLGFEFNNYRFDNKNSIMKDSLGIIVVKNYDQSFPVEKSKLSTDYLTCPLLLEFQIPVSHKKNKNIHIAAGVIGGLQLKSFTKVIFNNNEKTEKDKNDLNISPFRYGVTARIGYRSLNLFANYYLTPLFEKGNDPMVYNGYKGPELYPFSIGLVLVPFK